VVHGQLTAGSIADGLDRYEAIRRPATAQIVLANRQAGPEQSMDLVDKRAPNGFDRLDDVISDDELAEI
jgi:5-methylphenazine-1-carboxylate 1-monooxygenase